MMTNKPSATAIEDFTEQFRRWLEAPSFRAGFPHLFGRRARMVQHVARLLTEATPEQFAAVMNGIRPGRITRELKRRNLPYEMTAEAAERMRGTMTVAEVADLIDFALEAGRPNDTKLADVLNDLWQVEVNRYKPKKSGTEHEDPIIRGAQKARRFLGQARPAGRPKGTKRKRLT